LYRVNLVDQMRPIDMLRFQSHPEAFKIKTGTKMRRLVEAWLKCPTCVPASIASSLRSEEWRSLLQFQLNGHPIDLDDTAQSLGMMDKAVICVASLRSSPALRPHEGAPLTLAADIGRLLNNDDFHDVRFVVGPDEEIIGANRTILAARSERFFAMLKPSHSQESQMEEARTGEVVVPDHSPAAFRAMLQYIYTGETPVAGLKLLEEVLAVAHYYVIDALKARLEEELVARIALDNVAMLLRAGEHYQCHALKQACQECVAENFAELKGELASSLSDSPELLVEIASFLVDSPPRKRRLVEVED